MKENDKYKILWTALGVLLLLNIGLLVWISFFSNKLPDQPKRLYLETELNFDGKQAETYRNLRQDHAKQMRSLRENVKEMKEAFYADLGKPILDDSLKVRAQKIESKMAEADIITFRHFQQVRQMCTPAQQKHFDEVILDLIRFIERPGGGPQGGPNRAGPPPRDGRPRMDDMPPPHER